MYLEELLALAGDEFYQYWRIYSFWKTFAFINIL